MVEYLRRPLAGQFPVDKYRTKLRPLLFEFVSRGIVVKDKVARHYATPAVWQ